TPTIVKMDSNTVVLPSSWLSGTIKRTPYQLKDNESLVHFHVLIPELSAQNIVVYSDIDRTTLPDDQLKLFESFEANRTIEVLGEYNLKAYVKDRRTGTVGKSLKINLKDFRYNPIARPKPRRVQLPVAEEYESTMSNDAVLLKALQLRVDLGKAETQASEKGLNVRATALTESAAAEPESASSFVATRVASSNYEDLSHSVGPSRATSEAPELSAPSRATSEAPELSAPSLPQ
ncbi:hypothetical protein BGZ75_009579, partial [Mortierella antarctica]